MLDLGCGDGWIGQSMKDKGYSDFVGVDASQGMLDEAEKRGMYRELKKMFVGNNEMPAEWVGQFDVVVSCGCLVVGHFPNSSFDDFYNALKVGGHMLFSVRDKYYAPLGHEAYIQNMEKEGKIKFVDEMVWKKYEGLEDHPDMGIYAPGFAFIKMFKKLK